MPGQARLGEEVREEEAGNRGEQQIGRKIAAHVHVHLWKIHQ